MKVLILRPQPGAEESAGRARALGLEPLVSPLFIVRPLAWSRPDPAAFDGVLLTSANAARHGGDAMTPFLGLPCYAIGESTAAAAAAAGFTDGRAGPADGEALIAFAAKEGIRTAVHFCGQQHFALRHPDVVVTAVAVYTAEPVARLPEGADEALVLLHSPRAAALFARLAGRQRGRIRIAAISAQAASAAGSGWASADVAAEPRDHALLALAAKLCQS
ncbi:MAG TPA: uroporphyrinogen-III synthase [Allosphingosinicella sp.]|nr:uroporphyrinogen-III synthase [Allosphingosinicella sp.]